MKALATPTTSERYQLVAQYLARGEVLRLTVTSASMAPLVRPGDVVLAQPVGDAPLLPGDIIVAQRGNAWITHRVLWVNGVRCATHGDNSWIPEEPVALVDVVGRVVVVERGGRRIDLRSARWQKAGRLLARSDRRKLGLLRLGRGGKVASTLGTAEAVTTGCTRYLVVCAVWSFQVLNRMIVWIMLKFDDKE